MAAKTSGLAAVQRVLGCGVKGVANTSVGSYGPGEYHRFAQARTSVDVRSRRHLEWYDRRTILASVRSRLSQGPRASFRHRGAWAGAASGRRVARTGGDGRQ